MLDAYADRNTSGLKKAAMISLAAGDISFLKIDNIKENLREITNNWGYVVAYLTSISKVPLSASWIEVIFPSEALTGDNHPINPLAGKQPVAVWQKSR